MPRGFRINLPRIHPLEVIAAIADIGPRAENGYLARATMNDRDAALSG